MLYAATLRGPGEEICSGAQRVHEPAMLEKSIAAKGLPLEPLQVATLT